MDLEIVSINKISKKETHILLRDVPDEVTQGELKRYFALYSGPDEEFGGFAKVTMENGNEHK
jgi:hypothetical protein